MSALTTAVSDFVQWREARLASVTGPTGNLALVDSHPVTEQERRVDGLPFRAWRQEGLQGVWIRLTGPNVYVDDKAVEAKVFVERLRPDGTPIIRASQRSVDVFSLDGTAYELRIYDSASASLRNFAGIDSFDHDPHLIVQAKLEPFDELNAVEWDFTRAGDCGLVKQVPGTLVAEIGDSTYGLLAFVDGGNLVLVFADGTTGTESYAPGRFLKVPMPGPDGAVELDFNRAIVPPCGFSDYYSCPIPPPHNRIAEPIRAGEKSVLWKTPRT